MFERFFLGRTGDPLKYETAKQDIPSLTPQRYGNYMNYLYNDKGLLGLGIIKGTTENLQGNPEVRMLGFPVTLPMVGGFTAGTVAARQAAIALNRPGTSPVKKLLGTIAAAAGGSVAGVAAGNLTNAAIAAGNRPQLPTTSEYSSYTAQ
jgi:hypothetical protein